MELILSLLFLIFSVVLIAKGSDFLTDSLIPLAKRWQTTSTSLGLVLVSAAVSLPEILVGVLSALRGSVALSLGVVLGSVVCNIGLMTGVSALIRPLRVTYQMILRDGIFSVVVPILVLAVAADGVVGRLEGFSLFLLFIPYLTNVFLQERRLSFEEREILKTHSQKRLYLMGWQRFKLRPGGRVFALGVLLTVGGSFLLSDRLLALTRLTGFDPMVVGLLVGAVGTSIPNIASSYQATRRGLTEVAVSETLGSNVFTLLVTLGLVALVRPAVVADRWLLVDIPLTILLSLLLLVFMISQRSISRREGLILLGSYLLILFWQVALS